LKDLDRAAASSDRAAVFRPARAAVFSRTVYPAGMNLQPEEPADRDHVSEFLCFLVEDPRIFEDPTFFDQKSGVTSFAIQKVTCSLCALHK
jgi:hypothetical protein